jgi:von Hippel-Lindau disease tumor suppressor protein
MPRSLFASISVLAALGLATILSITDAQAASRVRGAKSQNSNTPVKVTFVNKSGEFRAVMWADFKGKLVPYANLEPGQKYTVNTFATHPWVFTDGPGNCIEMWVAQPGVSKFAITAKSTGKGGD